MITNPTDTQLQGKTLEPCPWCPVETELSLYHLPDSPSRHVYCRRCNGAGPWGDSDDEAIAVWNFRAAVAGPSLASVKEAIKSVEWSSDKSDPETMSTPNKNLGRYMKDVLVVVENTFAATSSPTPAESDKSKWPEQLTVIRYDDGGFSATLATPPVGAKFTRVYHRSPAATEFVDCVLCHHRMNVDENGYCKATVPFTSEHSPNDAVRCGCHCAPSDKYAPAESDVLLMVGLVDAVTHLFARHHCECHGHKDFQRALDAAQKRFRNEHLEPNRT